MAKIVGLIESLQPIPDVTTGTKTPAQKERDKIRMLAEQAVTECDPWLTTEVKRNGNFIIGTLDVTECALRFVGTMIADKAKDME